MLLLSPTISLISLDDTLFMNNATVKAWLNETFLLRLAGSLSPSTLLLGASTQLASEFRHPRFHGRLAWGHKNTILIGLHIAKRNIIERLAPASPNPDGENRRILHTSSMHNSMPKAGSAKMAKLMALY